jgi:outer membrane protein OmpA-like peptidoglycan-associated protein
LAAALVLVGVGSVRAEEVQMFQHVPSVEELRSALAPAKPRSRGIVLGDSSGPVAGDSSASLSASVGLPIAFGYDSANVLPESRPYLDQVGKLLRSDPALALLVEGHTDAVGSDEYNFSLSERRAEGVRRYLIATYAIAPSRLQHVGKGKSDPLNAADPAAPENRRVQFRRIEGR